MARSHAFVGALVALILAAVGAGAATGIAGAHQNDVAASSGSILYLKGGNLWTAAPDGRSRRRIAWSPDGKSLAWADARGIWVGQVGSTFGPEGPTCELTKRLVIPGGSKPDWGPARP